MFLYLVVKRHWCDNISKNGRFGDGTVKLGCFGNCAGQGSEIGTEKIGEDFILGRSGFRLPIHLFDDQCYSIKSQMREVRIELGSDSLYLIITIVLKVRTREVRIELIHHLYLRPTEISGWK